MFPHEPNTAEQIGEDILLWSDYDAEFVEALKTQIPVPDRKWNLRRQCWIIHERHIGELRRLVREHLGYMLVIS